MKGASPCTVPLFPRCPRSLLLGWIAMGAIIVWWPGLWPSEARADKLGALLRAYMPNAELLAEHEPAIWHQFLTAIIWSEVGIGWLHLLLHLTVAFALWKRKWWSSCLAASILASLSLAGAVVGVPTILWLTRPYVQRAFGRDPL